MDNQHRKIKGYRELSEEELDLMNRIKAKGAELLALHDEIRTHLIGQQAHFCECASLAQCDEDRDFAEEELTRIEQAEPGRWAAMGRTDIQTGIMKLVRAVAQPAGV